MQSNSGCMEKQVLNSLRITLKILMRLNFPNPKLMISMEYSIVFIPFPVDLSGNSISDLSLLWGLHHA